MLIIAVSQENCSLVQFANKMKGGRRYAGTKAPTGFWSVGEKKFTNTYGTLTFSALPCLEGLVLKAQY